MNGLNAPRWKPLAERIEGRTTTGQVWVLQAACRDDPEPWTDSSDPELKAWAEKECRERCPVIDQCRIAGEGEVAGIWAGVEKHAKKSTKRLKKTKKEKA